MIYFCLENRKEYRAANCLQNSLTARVSCCSDSVHRSRMPRHGGIDFEWNGLKHTFMFRPTWKQCAFLSESALGVIYSCRNAIVGEALDLFRIETSLSWREIELRQAPLLHIGTERGSGASKNRHGLSGVDQMAMGFCLLAAAEDAFRLFLGYGSVRLQECLDCVDGRLCHLSFPFVVVWMVSLNGKVSLSNTVTSFESLVNEVSRQTLFLALGITVCLFLVNESKDEVRMHLAF